MRTNKSLFLFDIDGTLITSGGAGEWALRRAVQARFGAEDDLSKIVLAGATDAAIAGELLKNNGLAESGDNIAALLDTYLHFLAEEMPKRHGRIMPGILPLLEALRARRDCVLGLLTGNLARGAEIKLSHYGVWDYFEFGAFADDSRDRNRLGHFARARAEGAHGIEFPPERIFILGDTPRDIECARAIGAVAVAIATGDYSPEMLAAENPDFLFSDLSDTDSVLSALLPPQA